MSFYTPQEIAGISVDAGIKKAKYGPGALLVLGFLAGAFIALGFMLDIRVTADMPKAWGTFSTFIGAAVFPVGLMLVVIAGGELLTGNMMTLPIAWLAKKVSFGQLLNNWFWVLIGNFIGSLFVAYFLGHMTGYLEHGPALLKTVAIAKAKLGDSFSEAFFSAIGCNWLVVLAVWMAYGAQTIGGKILAIWFPIMAFVAIGFQHVVANMFVIPAAIFAGYFTWGDWFGNFVPVLLGNIVGAFLFVSLAYWYTYIRPAAAGEALPYHADKKK